MQEQPASVLGSLTDSPWRSALAAIASGAFIGAIEFGVHTLVRVARLPRGVPRIADAVTIAVVTAVLVYIVLREWRVRRALVVQQLRVVSELNHNVRNALQTLLYSQYMPAKEQSEAVLQSVARIDKTLRELFPAIGERAADQHRASSIGRQRGNSF